MSQMSQPSRMRISEEIWYRRSHPWQSDLLQTMSGARNKTCNGVRAQIHIRTQLGRQSMPANEVPCAFPEILGFEVALVVRTLVSLPVYGCKVNCQFSLPPSL